MLFRIYMAECAEIIRGPFGECLDVELCSAWASAPGKGGCWWHPHILATDIKTKRSFSTGLMKILFGTRHQGHDLISMCSISDSFIFLTNASVRIYMAECTELDNGSFGACLDVNFCLVWRMTPVKRARVRPSILAIDTETFSTSKLTVENGSKNVVWGNRVIRLCQFMLPSASALFKRAGGTVVVSLTVLSIWIRRCKAARRQITPITELS